MPNLSWRRSKLRAPRKSSRIWRQAGSARVAPSVPIAGNPWRQAAGRRGQLLATVRSASEAVPATKRAATAAAGTAAGDACRGSCPTRRRYVHPSPRRCASDGPYPMAKLVSSGTAAAAAASWTRWPRAQPYRLRARAGAPPGTRGHRRRRRRGRGRRRRGRAGRSSAGSATDGNRAHHGRPTSPPDRWRAPPPTLDAARRHRVNRLFSACTAPGTAARAPGSSIAGSSSAPPSASRCATQRHRGPARRERSRWLVARGLADGRLPPSAAACATIASARSRPSAAPTWPRSCSRTSTDRSRAHAVDYA